MGIIYAAGVNGVNAFIYAIAVRHLRMGKNILSLNDQFKRLTLSIQGATRQNFNIDRNFLIG